MDGELVREFDEWWQLYPRQEKRELALQRFKAIRRDSVATAAELMDGVRRYAASVTDPKWVKYPTTWLNDKGWLDNPPPARPAASQAGSWSPPRFEGPAGLRDAVCAEKGEAWTCSWLDTCRWDAERRSVVPRTGLARDKLDRELRHLFRTNDVSVGEPQRTAA